MIRDNEDARRVQKALATELQRNLKQLRAPGHPSPYFLSYLLHAARGHHIWGRYGALFASDAIRHSTLYAEARVGSYRFDQTIDGNLNRDLAELDSYQWTEGPEELKPEVLRYCFWRLTQLKYWEALQDFYEKKKILVDQRLRPTGDDFSRAPVAKHIAEIEPARLTVKRWEGLVRQTSEAFKKHPRVLDPYVRLRALDQVRVFVNSEGSRFVAQERYYDVSVEGWAQSPDGAYVQASRHFFGRRPSEVPKLSELLGSVEEVARELDELSRAVPMDPYAGPALLSGNAAGLIFHEAIGHRLEGERMSSRDEGQTFANKIGARILPEGVHVWDDPTATDHNGQSLYGHYEIDDEGVRAERVPLVEDGILRNFLLSRVCPQGFRRSNGHGRRERHQSPMARMANLFVAAEQTAPRDVLLERLCQCARDRGLPHGILIARTSSGETQTDRYDFQAFKGVPTEAWLVEAKTGRRTRLRDLNFIGTPLAAVQRILAFGDETDVDNSYCFAESGSVPVSTIAPPMLVEELELQRTPQHHFRPPILSRPRF